MRKGRVIIKEDVRKGDLLIILVFGFLLNFNFKNQSQYAGLNKNCKCFLRRIEIIGEKSR
jgi:hypothetical protein